MSGFKRHMWRDSLEWKKQGLLLSTTSDRAAKMFDAVLTQFIGGYEDTSVGGIERSLEELVQADPNFAMAHVFSNGLKLIGTQTNIWKNQKLKTSIEEMAKLSETNTNISDREKKHVAAIQDFANGFVTKACATWEDILLFHPTDMMALKFTYDSYFYLGYQNQMRDCIARVLPTWNETIPLYGYLHGMYAFGWVETNFYNKAEEHARQGLAINPYDCRSLHAMCHVFEMQGKPEQGILFLSQTEKEWAPETLPCHAYWHWALYHIEKGEYDFAVDIFDKQVSERCKSGEMFDLVDGSALLYRLELEGVNVKDKWRKMQERWGSSHIDDHNWIFSDIHQFMCILGAKDEIESKCFLDSMRDYINKCQGTNCEVTKEVGLKICEALHYFDKGDYVKSTDLFAPIRYEIIKIGGSNPERDVFHQFLIHSAMRSPLKSHHCLARRLLAERKAMKENSPLTDRLMLKSIALH